MPQCQATGAEKTTLLPRDADLVAAHCATSLHDSQLVQRCQERKHGAHTVGRNSLRATSFPAWPCPRNASPVETKYTEQTFRGCETGHGTWGRRIEGQLKCVATTVAETLQLRP